MSKTQSRPSFLLVLFSMVLLAGGCGSSDEKKNSDPGDGPPDPELTDQKQLVLGTVLDAGDRYPLEGAIVGLGDIVARTDARGRFAISTWAAKQPRAVVASAEGFASVSKLLEAGGGHRIELGPILLADFDATAELGPEGGRLEAQDAGVTIDVPAGAFSEPVDLGVSRLPLGDPLEDPYLLPAALPDPPGGQVSALFGLIIHSGGVQPSAKLVVRVEAGGLPDGTRVPVGRFDEAAGRWVDVDLGTANDGEIQFETGHLSTFAAALPALPADDTAAPAMSSLERSISPFMPGDPRIDPRSGALQVGAPIPALIRRDEEIDLSFFYDSRTVRPKPRVPVAATDAKEGEKLTGHIVAPTGNASLDINVQESATAKTAPAVLVELEEKDGPEETATAEGEEAPYVLEAASGTHIAEVRLSRSGEGMLAESSSGSFAEPETGEPLLDSDDEVIPSPNPFEHRRSDQVAVAVDNREQSPFGSGWHLTGLTRLIQPWCISERITLVGELDWPALTFGEIADSVVRPLAPVFEEVDIDEDELDRAQVTTSGGMIYAALPSRGEVWRLEPDGSSPVLVAGGGHRVASRIEHPGPELDLGRIVTISAGPSGDGILIATERYVAHLVSDGNAVLVAGSGDPCNDEKPGNDIRIGEPAVNSSFCDSWGLSYTLAADPTSDRFVFASLDEGTFDVVEGELRQLRTKVGAGPHWHTAAFDPQGRLYYSTDMGQCIYVHEDGLIDEELFPRCREPDATEMKDGTTDEAVAGGGRAMTFDRYGNLWFIDTRFHSIRRYSSEGDLITVSARSAGIEPFSATAHGALLGNTVPGDVTTLAIHDPTRIFMGGKQSGDLATTAPVDTETLVSMGSGDGSILHAIEEEGYVRVRESGVVEHYDERGLLQSRGMPGEPQLEYVYEGDWESDRASEVCGVPAQPPRLASIELSGEELWGFRYDTDGMLDRVIDAAGRTVRRRKTGEDAFELPCGARIQVEHDDDGMLTRKRAPGPEGNADVWDFEWDARKLIAITRPGGTRIEIGSAEDEVKVPEGRFDALGVARDVPAHIPRADVPTRSGETARVTVGTTGVLVEDPSGDETELETDDFGRLLRVTLPDGGSLRLSRDEVGRLVNVVNEATGRGWSYSYARVGSDAAGNPYLEERLVERRDHKHQVTRFRYDSNGFLEARTDPNGGVLRSESVVTGAARGLAKTVRDQEGRVSAVTYDSRGNMTRMQTRDPEDPSIALTTEIERDAVGRPVKITEPSGKVVRTKYDDWGEPTEVTIGDPQDGHTVRITRASTASWTQGGSPIPTSPVLEATDGEGRTWRYSWAPGWRILESHEPARGRTAETYDEEGRVIERSLADGSHEEFAYGDTGRLEERRWYGPSYGSWASFIYDENQRIVELEGALTREVREFTPGFGWSDLTLISKSGLPAEAGFSMRRGRVSNRETQELSGASVYEVSRGFDDRVEVVTLRAGGGGTEEALSIERDLSRRVMGIERGNGTKTTIERDPFGRMIRQEEVTPSGVTVLSWTWEGDWPSSYSVNDTLREYAYDEHGRLVGCSDTEEEYSYDMADGRASDGERSYERDSEGRLKNDGLYDYEHDLLGRRVLRVDIDDASDRTVYTYGPGGYLETVSHGPEGEEAEIASYQYDASGRRITRTTSEGTWHYGYLPESERPSRIVEPDGTEWHLFHVPPAAAWRMAVADDGRRRYTHLDPLDRVIGVSDENGELTLLEEGCFGQRIGGPAPSGPPVGFHGMPYDEETGLYYAGARYYDPVVGAFLSPDPVGLDAAPALYDYAAGNPVIAQDPSGRALFWAAVGAAAVGTYVFNEIRKVTQSDEVRNARKSYESMTDDVWNDDGALESAEKAHSRLDQASRRAGQTAVDCTVKASRAIIDPANNALDAASAVKDAAESIMDDSGGGSYPTEDE